ncbi:unnamed protein product, partial [Staurois parvus]
MVETAAMGGAVQGPMTHSGPGSSMRRRYIGAHGRLGAWQQLWEEPRNLPAPYDKKKHQQCVRRPESGTWQSVWRWRQQQWEAVTGTHDRLWTWQQH